MHTRTKQPGRGFSAGKLHRYTVIMGGTLPQCAFTAGESVLDEPKTLYITKLKRLLGCLRLTLKMCVLQRAPNARPQNWMHG